MVEEPDEVELSERELTSFAERLDGWAADLPPEERGLLQFLLARAEAARTNELVSLSTDASPGQLASAMLRPLLANGVISRTSGTQPSMRCRWTTWTRSVPPTG